MLNANLPARSGLVQHTIFISYRRDDSEGEAGRLFDDLTRAYGSDAVFMDVAGIAPGVDFRKAIDDNVSACGVFLAVIGPQWATIAGANGARRLDDANDFVRLEIASALARKIAVIPVLVHGAKMPRPESLPDDIQDLAYRNSVEISHARWNSDVELLVGALKAYVTSTASTANQPVHATIPVQLPPPITPYAAPEAGKSKLPLILGASLAAIVLVAAIAFFALNRKTDVSVPVTSAASNVAGGGAPVAPAPVNPPAAVSYPLAGTWVNARASTGPDALQELKISGSGSQYSVEPWGSCRPVACSWGAQTLTFDGTQMAGTWKVRALPGEVRSNRTNDITITPLSGGLDVKTINSHTPRGGQTIVQNSEFRFVQAQ
jgi:hypothetical protein